MFKENLDKMQPNNKTSLAISLKIILRFLLIIILGVGIWFCVSIYNNYKIITTYEVVELDTEEKLNYITDLFHIKNTDNIRSYNILFNEGCMTTMMHDVKDIHELCFENLAYYKITEKQYNEIIRIEKEYNEIVNTPHDEYASDEDYNNNSSREIDEKWVSSWISPNYNHWEIKFRDREEHYSIKLFKASDASIRCEIQTGWGKLEV